ncbi:MAG TPA: DUF167 domain-containing protein [Patescibacteria group bacterium]|nr:DUF167 domain-containing protein [Patescibacteria group bacterium]
MSRIIRVTVNTRAREDKIEELDLDTYKVWVTAAPADNEANIAVKELLADYFNTLPANIKIKSGMHGKHKFIEIDKTSE